MTENWFVIEQLNKTVSSFNFWKSIGILISKPFTLNKFIGGCEFFNLGPYSMEKFDEIKSFIKNVLKSNPKGFTDIKTKLNDYLSIESLSAKTVFENIVLVNTSEQKNMLFLRLIYPRNGILRTDIFDLVYCDFFNCLVKFKKIYYANAKPYLLPNLPFQISYSQEILSLSICKTNSDLEDLNFLKNTLFSKISVWMQSNLKTDQIYSLNLIEVDNYIVLYNELKKKYFDEVKKIWTECTNVEKFIHEDIAIASYLILLWGKIPQRFFDLGCGNGLLVYILNNEGHNGVGIDIRARKIWSNYPSSTVLKEMSITPSDDVLFPDADWIIGNHSDELTPWIPVISFRSSYKTNFFLLPCCAYEFDGRKYCRTNTKKSQYLCYMDYVEEICKACGFITLHDRLRIPSTKRLCFVSFGRTYDESEYEKIDKEIITFIKKKSELSFDNTGKWLAYYKPREPKEKARNCTQIEKSIIQNIVNYVSNILLERRTSDNLAWNEGIPVSLKDIVRSIPTEFLQPLKKEFGGLQTLLKNHHIFKIENGFVKFRKPIEKNIGGKNWKKQECWFFKNHPDSCPLNDDKCSFKHSK